MCDCLSRISMTRPRWPNWRRCFENSETCAASKYSKARNGNMRWLKCSLDLPIVRSPTCTAKTGEVGGLWSSKTQSDEVLTTFGGRGRRSYDDGYLDRAGSKPQLRVRFKFRVAHDIGGCRLREGTAPQFAAVGQTGKDQSLRTFWHETTAMAFSERGLGRLVAVEACGNLRFVSRAQGIGGSIESTEIESHSQRGSRHLGLFPGD